MLSVTKQSEILITAFIIKQPPEYQRQNIVSTTCRAEKKFDRQKFGDQRNILTRICMQT